MQFGGSSLHCLDFWWFCGVWWFFSGIIFGSESSLEAWPWVSLLAVDQFSWGLWLGFMTHVKKNASVHDLGISRSKVPMPAGSEWSEWSIESDTQSRNCWSADQLRRCRFASAASCREVVRCCLAISLLKETTCALQRLSYMSAVYIIFSTVCGSCQQSMALTWSRLVWIHALGSRHWQLQACSPMVLRELILKGPNKFTCQKKFEKVCHIMLHGNNMYMYCICTVHV